MRLSMGSQLSLNAESTSKANSGMYLTQLYCWHYLINNYDKYLLCLKARTVHDDQALNLLHRYLCRQECQSGLDNNSWIVYIHQRCMHFGCNLVRGFSNLGCCLFAIKNFFEILVFLLLRSVKPFGLIAPSQWQDTVIGNSNQLLDHDLYLLISEPVPLE